MADWERAKPHNTLALAEADPSFTHLLGRQGSQTQKGRLS